MRAAICVTQFGTDGREILALAHALLRHTYRGDHPMFVRQLHDQFFIHWLNEENLRARLRVERDPLHGWVFQEMS
jgi:hypothetical protein